MAGWIPPGYDEVRELGAGGGGRVVLARHQASGSVVAIKYLPDRLMNDPPFVAAFREEARLLAGLVNPHVARLHAYVETANGAAIVMEAVDGASLRKVLSEHGAVGSEAALVVLKGSLLGLAAAHDVGVVHRDFKPDNVLVQGDGQSKLVDFGIAVRSGEAGVRAGTPAYMAPEQWRGEPVAPATDVYAATCTFFECVTGHKPYDAASQADWMSRHTSAPIPVDDVPEPIRGLVTRGMAKDLVDRPPGAAAFMAELEEAATAGYGPDWERRGWRRLAELAGALAAVFPLAALSGVLGGGAPTVGSTVGQGLSHVWRSVPTVRASGRAVWYAAGAAVIAVTAVLVVPHIVTTPKPEPARPPAAAPPLTVGLATLTEQSTDPPLRVRATYARVNGGDPATVRKINTALLAPMRAYLREFSTSLGEARKLTGPTEKYATFGTRVTMGLRGPRLVST